MVKEHSFKRLEARSFQNVVVVPFTELLAWGDTKVKYKGGPIWPNWEYQKEIRFNGSFDEPIDRKPDYRKPTINIKEGKYFYVGPIYKHFGHQIRDFSSRIFASVLADAEAILVFVTHCKHTINSVDEVPTFFKEILKWFDITLDRIIIVNEPTLFKRMYVVPESESPTINVKGLKPLEEYINGLTAYCKNKKIAQVPIQNTFVSRTQFSSLQLGEYEIERWLKLAGFRIFYPENHTMEEQLTVYLSSPLIVFSEGSSMHLVQLLGKCLSTVVVIQRRPEILFGQSFLEARAEDVIMVDAVKGYLNFNAHSVYNIAVLDYARLTKTLIKICPQLENFVGEQSFRKSQKKQLYSLLRTTMPRTLTSTMALAKSLFEVKPKGYVGVIFLALVMTPVDIFLRVRAKFFGTI